MEHEDQQQKTVYEQKQLSVKEQKEAILNKYPELKALTEDNSEEMDGQTSIIIFPKRTGSVASASKDERKEETPPVTTKTKEEILEAPKESLIGEEGNLKFLFSLYPEWTLQQAIDYLDLVY